MARRKLTLTEIRIKYAADRKALSQLKKRGLISKRANLRKAKPSLALRKKLEDLRPVLNGYAQAIKLSPEKTKQYKNSGKKVYGKYLVFDKQPEERIKVSKKGDVQLVSDYQDEAFDQIILPINVKDFKTFYEWLSDDPEQLQTLAGPKDFFGFTLFGHSSNETGDARWLLNYLQNYKVLFAQDGSVSSDANDAFRHFILYRLSEKAVYSFGLNKDRKYRRNKTVQDRRLGKGGYFHASMTEAERQAKYRKKIKTNPKKGNKFRASEAERKRKFRQRVKQSKPRLNTTFKFE